MASLKRFDWFGAYVVGLVTAIGGGTIRDLLLKTTPFWMNNSNYLICTAVALLFVVLFEKNFFRFKNTFFLFDTIGLALFVVVGFEKTILFNYPYWVAVIMATMTGAAGGIIRDILINEAPLIFRKEIYALACVLGSLVYIGLDMLGAEILIKQIFTAATVIVIRFLAVYFKIGLPVLKGEKSEENDF